MQIESVSPQNEYMSEQISRDAHKISDVPETTEHTARHKRHPDHLANLRAEENQKLDREKAQSLAKAMESYASAMGSELNFKLDEKNNVLQVEVIDPATDKVIRKIPPDELLNLANSLEKATAVMINRMF